MAYCSNVSCPGRILESIVHFAAVMDIRGLGYERVRALLDAKLIKDVADLYELTPAQLLKLEGFAEKSAQQDRKSTRLNSSHSQISYAVFCLKKKKIKC